MSGDREEERRLLLSRSMVTNMISGGMGGLCVVLVGYPFDLLKTRLQTTVTDGRLLQTVRSLLRQSGWRGLYQGVTAPLIGVTPIFAANFYGLELGKRLWDWVVTSQGRVVEEHSLWRTAMGSFYSALQTAAIVIPAERVKVFMQLPHPPDSPIARFNALQATAHLWRLGGLRQLFKGTTATLARDVPGLMTFFTSYEWFKRLMRDHESGETISWIKVLCAGGLAGITSWMVSLPSDVIKSRLQALPARDPIHQRPFPTLVILGILLRNEGPLALYKGLLPVLLRAFPANAACFLGFEATKRALDRL